VRTSGHALLDFFAFDATGGGVPRRELLIAVHFRGRRRRNTVCEFRFAAMQRDLNVKNAAPAYFRKFVTPLPKNSANAAFLRAEFLGCCPAQGI